MMDDVGGQNDGGTFFTGAQIQNASNLPQAGGLIPGLYNQKASKLRQAGQGGDGGLDGPKPGGPQNGQSGNDGGILIYEDIG
jgi:hypothetical protein